MAPPPLTACPRAAPAVSAGRKLRSRLLQAASDGDLRTFKRVAEVLDKGMDRLRETVEAVKLEGDEEVNGVGALHLAAGNGMHKLCAYLVVGLRVDVNAVDDEGRTPLIYALYRENVDIATYLLDNGANQDKADHNGFAPLHYAAGSGNCEIVELLLARGAYADPVTCCGTPLHIAATEGQDCNIKVLLDHNADYNKMVNGMTPLYFAINAASVECVKLLLEAGDVANEDYILTALIDAPKNGSSECPNCVLGIGVGWHAPNDNEPVNKRKIAELKSQGSKAAGRNDFLSAAGFYSMAMDLDPDDATLFSDRSGCWAHMDKPLLSLLDALECMKRQPDWPNAYYRQSKALMILRDYKGMSNTLLDGLNMDLGKAEHKDVLRDGIDNGIVEHVYSRLGNTRGCF